MSRAAAGQQRYRGVRRRAWGKWVSEIRVPGTRERLWLGSYAAPEAAAVAHDAAACLLRGRLNLNFPERVAGYAAYGQGSEPLSPRSVQRIASDAGMAADAQIVDARAGIGAARGAQQGRATAPYAPPPPDGNNGGGGGSSTRCCWSSAPSAGGSRSSSAGSDQQLVYGDISVDDIEILI